MRSVIVAWVALAFASPAVADMSQVELGRYRCSAPAGQRVNAEILPLKRDQEMRVAFRLIRADPAASHPGTTGVIFESPNGQSTITFGRAVNDPFQMYAAVQTPAVPVQQTVYEYALTKNWVILKLTLDEHRYLTVRSNDLLQRFPMGTTQVTKTWLQCSSGEWEIDVWPRSYVFAPQ